MLPQIRFPQLRNGRRLFTILHALLRAGAFGVATPGLGGSGLAGSGLVGRLLFGLADPHVRLRPYGQRLAWVFARLGPTFIKFGQALSTRPDLVGEAVAADLAELQDRLPPFPTEQARAIVEAELERPMDELYAQFSEQPVAAASIAQVHRAVTIEGVDVAVKILRPGVEAQFEGDIVLLYWLARLAVRLRPSLRRLRPVEAVQTFEDSVTLEMDLRFEAAAAAEMAENFLDDETFRIPKVDWRRTARRVMTVAWVDGIPIDEVEALRAAGLDPEKVVESAAAVFFNMVFRDGFFHADLHPGNLFIDKAGAIVAVDFGITGRVDQQTRRFLGEMLLSFLKGDYRRVAEVHFEAGFVPPDKSIEAFMQACRSIAEPIFGRPLYDISVARLLGQLFAVTETFAMEVQPQLLLLQKSMLVIEGVGRRLAPHANMWNLAQPLIERWMIENLSPQAKIRQTMSSLAATLESIPRIVAHAEMTVQALRNGGVRLHPESLRSFSHRGSGFLSTWAPWLLVVILLVLLLRR